MGKWLLVIAQLLVCFFCFILFDLCIEDFPTGTPFFFLHYMAFVFRSLKFQSFQNGFRSIRFKLYLFFVCLVLLQFY